MSGAYQCRWSLRRLSAHTHTYNHDPHHTHTHQHTSFQALDNALVTPNKILIQKAPDNHEISFPHAVGIIHCNVLQAEKLPAADWSTGQCDPYVKLVLASKGHIRTQEANTKMIEANRFPVYNEHFEFRVFRCVRACACACVCLCVRVRERVCVRVTLEVLRRKTEGGRERERDNTTTREASDYLELTPTQSRTHSSPSPPERRATTWNCRCGITTLSRATTFSARRRYVRQKSPVKEPHDNQKRPTET